jgi:outer membrane lipoprotein SlyB
VAPKWNRGSLYGQNYNDARGLICGGDFSLSQMTDAWATYQLNNKNYQASFDRNIESIELKNSVQGTLDVVNALTGTLSGAVTGGMTGSMMGAGPYSAVAGAVAGGVASGVGGVADVQINKMLREDALDLTKDQFGYNLQNIQAVPQSLRKVTAFNPNNKIFPFVEYYACSAIETEALRNKIKYNGMTIMRIGTIAEFIQEEPSYIKGKLIRLENVGDNHMVAEIASELNQGIFI